MFTTCFTLFSLFPWQCWIFQEVVSFWLGVLALLLELDLGFPRHWFHPAEVVWLPVIQDKQSVLPGNKVNSGSALVLHKMQVILKHSPTT